MATQIPKEPGNYVAGLRRAVAAIAVRGRRTLERQSGLVGVVDTRPMVDLSAGQVRHVPLTGNDFCRYIIGNVAGFNAKNLLTLAARHGLLREPTTKGGSA